jgi:Zn-dependent protease
MNILGFLISFSLLILAMSVHEFSHGWVAYKLGDNTARYSGRLTLNPIAHIDPVWTVIIPLVLFVTTGGRFIFGAAKPVPINYWALKNPKRDMVWIGLSGPLSNFIFAFLLSILNKAIPVPVVLGYLLENLILVNIILGVFNLIPIPPLDGSRILSGLLPEPLASRYASIEPFGFIVIMMLMTLGLFDFIVCPAVRIMAGFLGVSF